MHYGWSAATATSDDLDLTKTLRDAWDDREQLSGTTGTDKVFEGGSSASLPNAVAVIHHPQPGARKLRSRRTLMHRSRLRLVARSPRHVSWMRALCVQLYAARLLEAEPALGSRKRPRTTEATPAIAQPETSTLQPHAPAPMTCFTLNQANDLLPLVKVIAAELIERRTERQRALKVKEELEGSHSPEGLHQAIGDLDLDIGHHDGALAEGRKELEHLGLTLCPERGKFG